MPGGHGFPWEYVPEEIDTLYQGKFLRPECNRTNKPIPIELHRVNFCAATGVEVMREVYSAREDGHFIRLVARDGRVFRYDHASREYYYEEPQLVQGHLSL